MASGSSLDQIRSPELRKQLQAQLSSTRINLADLYLGDEGAQDLAKFFKFNNNYQTIDLKGNNLSQFGFEAVCRVLKESVNLKQLNAEWNSIGQGSNGLGVLHDLVRQNRSIQCIDLRNNELRAECAASLANVIKDSISLEILDLRWNELGNEGARVLIPAIKSKKGKLRVELDGNSISEELLASIEFDDTPSEPKYQPTPVSNNGPTVGSASKQYKLPPTSPPQQTPKTYSATGGHPPLGSGTKIPTPQHNQTPSNYQFSPNSTGFKSKAFQTSSASQLPTVSSVQPSQFSVNQPSLYKVENNKYAPPVSGTTTVNNSYQTGFANQYPTPTSYPEPSQEPQYTNKYDVKVNHPTGISDPYRPPESTFTPDRRYMGSASKTTGLGGYTTGSGSSNTLYPSYQYAQTGPKSNPLPFTPQSNRTTGPTNTLNEYNVREREAKFENEIRELKFKQETLYDQYSKADRALKDAESNIENERVKSEKIEEKLQAALRDVEVEKKFKRELEEKTNDLMEQIHKREFTLNDCAFEIERIKKENDQLRNENNDLKSQNTMNADHLNSRFNEAEQKFQQNVRDLTHENSVLQSKLDAARQEYETQNESIKHDYELKYKYFEDQLRNFSNVNNELSDELKKQTDFVQKLRFEQDDMTKRAIQRGREEEYQRYQSTVKTLEQKNQALSDQNDQLGRKNTELVRENQALERKLKDATFAYEGDASRLKAEMDRMHEQSIAANSQIERVKNELLNKESQLTRVESEMQNLQNELQRARANQFEEGEKARREFEMEKKRLEDNERNLVLKLQDMDRQLRESQQETRFARSEYERLKESLQGNVSKIISQTFVDYTKPGNTKPPGTDFNFY